MAFYVVAVVSRYHLYNCGTVATCYSEHCVAVLQYKYILGFSYNPFVAYSNYSPFRILSPRLETCTIGCYPHTR